MLKCLYVAAIASLFPNALCTSVQEKKMEILDRLLSPDRYDPRIRPNATTDGPTKITVNMFVRSISLIDDIKMRYKVQLTFRYTWEDDRLRYDEDFTPYIPLSKPNLLWQPDLFFSNEMEGHFHDIVSPNFYIRIFPDGRVMYSRRLSLTLGCPMNLKAYPFDQQVCGIRIASYGSTVTDINLEWKEGDPVQVVRNLAIYNFYLQKFWMDACNSKTVTGIYSCIKVDFLFKRNFLHYLLEVYLPSYMLVIISWTSFWFDPKAVTARLMLSFGTLLVLALQTSFMNASMPRVSYVKSIDIWSGVCLTFIFASFIEFVVVHYMCRIKHKEVVQTTSDNDGLLTKKCTLRQHFNKLNCFESWSKKFKTRVKCLDVTSRIFFPVLFALFNLIYWVFYTTQSE